MALPHGWYLSVDIEDALAPLRSHRNLTGGLFDLLIEEPGPNYKGQGIAPISACGDFLLSSLKYTTS